MSLDPDDELKYFHPWADIQKSGIRLPHWQQPGASYFITFSQADAVPAELQNSLNEQKTAWQEHHPEPWDEATTHEFHERFSGARERWLDAGHGTCFLRGPAPRSIVSNALRHFDGERYALHSAVVMPNHAHALITLRADQQLEKLMHSWKSYTAHEMVRTAPAAPSPFWQADYFDRLIRDREHFQNCARYIRRNPAKAKLNDGEFTLYESPLARKAT